MKFKLGDEVIVVNPLFKTPLPGAAGRVVDRLRHWSQHRSKVVHEYSVAFEGYNGTFSVEEEDIEHNGPLDRLAREA